MPKTVRAGTQQQQEVSGLVILLLGFGNSCFRYFPQRQRTFSGRYIIDSSELSTLFFCLYLLGLLVLVSSFFLLPFFYFFFLSSFIFPSSLQQDKQALPLPHGKRAGGMQCCYELFWPITCFNVHTHSGKEKNETSFSLDKLCNRRGLRFRLPAV